MSRSDYNFGSELGRGSFGVVYRVERKADQAAFVCKQITLRGMNAKMQGEARAEVALLRKVSRGCEFVVQYVESFLEDQVLHIVMELCANGDLAGYLQKAGGKRLPEETTWKFALQVGMGLRWLHENRVLHRDIKPLNVFLTEANDARIGDLGIARTLEKDSDFAKTLIGTPFYLSPEVCSAQPYNEKSDVWAYGCVVYELAALRRPFEGANNAALLMRIVDSRYAPLPADCSEDLHDLVAGCLQRDMDQRKSMAELLSVPAAQAWAANLGLLGGGSPDGSPGSASGGDSTGGEQSPERARAWRKWRQITTHLKRLTAEVTKELNPAQREVWDNLYMLFRAKMASEDLTDDDYADIEKHVFEELPLESTDLIMKVAKILQLEAEADHHHQTLMGG